MGPLHCLLPPSPRLTKKLCETSNVLLLQHYYAMHENRRGNGIGYVVVAPLLHTQRTQWRKYVLVAVVCLHSRAVGNYPPGP